MENLRITLLDAVRLDAIAKLKKTDLGVKEQQNKVIDAAKKPYETRRPLPEKKDCLLWKI